MESFSQAIRQRRKELGMTISDLAARIRFEDGRTLSGPYLIEICKWLHWRRRPDRRAGLNVRSATMEQIERTPVRRSLVRPVLLG